MKFCLPILLILVVFVSSTIKNLNQKEIEKYFDSLVNQAFREKYGISSLALSVTQGPETVFFKGYGYQNPDEVVGVTNDTIFGLASISKTFIAASAVKLFSKEKFKDDVNEYLTGFKVSETIHGNYYSHFGGKPHVKSHRNVQIWNLLTHTEGFDAEMSLRYRHQTNTLLEDIQQHIPPRIRQTSIVSTYSNYGASLMALIIEQNNPKKMEYGDYIKNTIFDPLKMTKTFYGIEAAKKNDPNKICHQTTFSKKGTYDKLTNFLGDNIGSKPAGIVYSSSSDMQNYAKTFLRQINTEFFTNDQHSALFDPLFSPNHPLLYSTSPSSSRNSNKTSKPFFENSISSIVYTKNIGPVGWIGHDGDLPPYHSQMMLNFENNISFILLSSAKTGSFRDILRRDFTHKFLMSPSSPSPKNVSSSSSSSFSNDNSIIEKFCPQLNETIEGDHDKNIYDNGLCRKTMSLSNDFPREISTVKKNYQENYVGCYLPFRFVHTSFLTAVTELFLFSSSNAICLELLDDGKYLGIKQESEDNQFKISVYNYKNGQDILFLESTQFQSQSQLGGKNTEFVIAQRRSQDIVEIILGDTSPPVATFVFDEKNRYLVLYDVYNTFEHFGSKSDVFWAYFLYVLYTAASPVIGGFILLLCCYCVCCCGYQCCCCQKITDYIISVIKQRRRRGVPLIGAKSSINSHDLYFWKKNVAQEYDLIGDENQLSKRNRASGIFFGGINPKKDRSTIDTLFSFFIEFFFELNFCCVVQSCFLLFGLLVLGFNLLHYIFMYVLGVYYLEKEYQIPVIVDIGSYLPIGSIASLGVLCVGCCGCCVICTCCFECLVKGSIISKHRCCQFCCLCSCVIMICGTAILYYVLAAYFNSFAFVNLVNRN